MALSYDVAQLSPAADCEDGTFTTIFDVPGLPGMLCKQVDQILVDGRYDELSTGARRLSWYTREQFFGAVGDDLALLRAPKYGLERFIPRTDLEWGVDDKGVERGFIITERVNGVGLSDYGNMDEALAADIDEMLAGLLTIGIDHSGRPELGRKGKLPDIMRFGVFNNLIVGTTISDPVVRPRIVDVHPVLAPEISGNAGKW